MDNVDIAALAFTILTCLIGVVALPQFSRWLSYLKDHPSKLKRLIGKLDELNARESYICLKLEEGWLQEGKEPNPEVALWQKQVDNIRNSINICSIQQEISEPRGYLFLNFLSRRKLGKLIEEKIKEVTEVFEKSQFSDDSLVYLPRKRGMKFDTSTLRDLRRNRKVENEILMHLVDSNIQCVCVWGMGGVGKTTIMESINNKLRELTPITIPNQPSNLTYSFDNVIWATVAKDSNVLKLQDNIACKLGLDLSRDQDVMSRRARLSEALERRGRFVLILDDIWEAYSLKDVGIPLSKIENGSKLVLTTRIKSLCHGMGIKKEVVVEVNMLNSEESWGLLKDAVGYEVLQSLEIQTIANDVLKECGGLPLAIITVGRALKDRNEVNWWKNARDELRTATARIDNVEEKVFACLRFSYERLSDDETRNLFLCCALYPEDDHIDTKELIEHWMWDGLVGDESKVAVKIRRGKIILKKLIEACMLLKVYKKDQIIEEEKEYVKMHDLIRDMALQITREEPRFIIKPGVLGEECLSEVECTEDTEKISFMESQLLRKLPDQPRCPMLTSLLLQFNAISKIPNSFFDHMHNLRILNLSYNPIEYLPDGMKVLKNLRYLDLRGTLVTRLPSGLLSSLTSLEDFRLGNAANEHFGVKSFPGIYALSVSSVPQIEGEWLEELKFCTKLKVLQLGPIDITEFNNYVCCDRLKQLESFYFLVGSRRDEFPYRYIGNRRVTINKCYGIVSLPANTDALKIIGHCEGSQMSNMLSGLHKLKTCAINSCIGTPDFMVTLGNHLHMIDRLYLFLVRTPNALWREDFAPLRVVENLTVLSINNCNYIKTLLFCKLLKNLPNLEMITVLNCSKLEQIVVDETEENNIISLPRLHQLKLEGLSGLKYIYKGMLHCGFLQKIEVKKCPLLRRLPLYLGDSPEQLFVPSTLTEISGEKIWWDSLEWNHPNTKTLLQPLFKETHPLYD